MTSRRFLLLILLASLRLAKVRATEAPAPDSGRARELIGSLQLSYLPGESGFLGLIDRSVLKVTVEGRQLAAQNQVYYLLTAESPINYLHWLASDDTHILLEGGPVDYFIFHPDGRVEKKTLGHDITSGQLFVVAVPAGCRKALRLHRGVKFALMANVLSPEWTQDRVKIGAGDDFIRQYRGRADWATPEFLRELIGPNYLPARGP